MQNGLNGLKGCLVSSKASMLVNGSPSNEFDVTKGLRQGNPLAPFLFAIIMEGLSGMIREAVEKNLFQSFLVGDNKKLVNLLQYSKTHF